MVLILIADGDTRNAQATETALRTPGRRFRICASGLAALELAIQEAPALAVIDAAIPGLGGVELCRRLRLQLRPAQMPILLVSGSGTAEDRIAGLSAGADDCLSKPFAMRELELRASVLLRRAGYEETDAKQDTLQVGGLRLDLKTYRAAADGQEAQLTPVEYDLLRYLMMRPGEVISAEQLLQDVWRYYPGTGDAAVVRMQVMNLRDKLEQNRQRPKYIQTVYRHGYMVAP